MVSALLAFVVISASPADAQWTVEREIDSMTDAELLKALVRNAAGHELSFSRSETTPQVFATFALSQQSVDILDQTAPLMYRVDKNNPRELKVDADYDELLGFASVIAEPKWVHWLVWHGEDETVQSGGSLGQFMAGESVVVRYFLFTGGFKETSFRLDGAGSAIAVAVGAELAQ